MIDYIKGNITELTPTSVVIETGGIGYLAHISLSTYSSLDKKSETKLFIYEVIREDAHLLFGFNTKEERNMFLLLISVSGVGANTARVILSSLSVGELQHCILQDNLATLKGIKGIGLKTAQRLIIDLKDKIDSISTDNQPSIPGINSQIKEEAASALQMLGFQQNNINKTLDQILKSSPSISIEQAIKQALQML